MDNRKIHGTVIVTLQLHMNLVNHAEANFAVNYLPIAPTTANRKAQPTTIYYSSTLSSKEGRN
jgi:hypothetical protein